MLFYMDIYLVGLCFGRMVFHCENYAQAQARANTVRQKFTGDGKSSYTFSNVHRYFPEAGEVQEVVEEALSA